MHIFHLICFSLVGAAMGTMMGRAKTTGEATVALIGIIALIGSTIK